MGIFRDTMMAYTTTTFTDSEGVVIISGRNVVYMGIRKIFLLPKYYE